MTKSAQTFQLAQTPANPTLDKALEQGGSTAAILLIVFIGLCASLYFINQMLQTVLKATSKK